MSRLTYVCSDLHGHWNAYKSIKELLNEDDELIILGDVIDRGDSSIKILQDIISDKRIKFVIGNHEMFLLMCYSKLNKSLNPLSHEFLVWTMPCNGGSKTVDQFLSLTKEEQADIVKYLENSYVQIVEEKNDKKFLLCHSSFIDKDKTVRTLNMKECSWEDSYNAVWYHPCRRNENFPLACYHEYKDFIFITGHVPVQRITGENKVVKIKNFVDIDFGLAGNSGVTCLFCLNDLSYNIIECGEDKIENK